MEGRKREEFRIFLADLRRLQSIESSNHGDGDMKTKLQLSEKHQETYYRHLQSQIDSN